MAPQPVAVPVRRGEHGCCRLARAEDRRCLGDAFVRDALARRHKVVYLCDGDAGAVAGRLGAADWATSRALAAGRLDVRAAREVALPDGAFDVGRMLEVARQERGRARAEGCPALSLMTDMAWALDGAPGTERLAEYEQRLDALFDEGLAALCVYDQGEFATGTLADVTAEHGVDVAPELGPILRSGCLTAARLRDHGIVRLSGDLDFTCAQAVADVLDAHFHGHLRLDLADLAFIDIAGLRALRGRKHQRVTIMGASACVRRLLEVLGSNGASGIEVAGAARRQ